MVIFIDFKGEDTCFDDGDKISVKKPLLPSGKHVFHSPKMIMHYNAWFMYEFRIDKLF